MKEVKNAKLTIGRISSNNPHHHNNIEIEVRDEFYNVVTKISITSEKFAHALTGMAMVECQIKVKENVNG